MTRRTSKKKQKLEKTAGEGGDISRSSGSEEETPSVYLIVSHSILPQAYSVFKVEPYGDGAGDGDSDSDDSTPPARIPRPLARLCCKPHMSFIPVRSRHGAWIVGVGGLSTACQSVPETIIFDTKTHAVIKGPKPGSTKRFPVLLPVGDRIYSMARRPSVNGRCERDMNGQMNFLPWFEVLDLSQSEVLDLSQSEVVDGRLMCCDWKPLPEPPFFPWELTPMDYLSPPENLGVMSYAAVGSHLLFSACNGPPGTHAFNTETERWALVDDSKDLPFINGAIPHGDLFLGISQATDDITAYKINLADDAGQPSLSIAEVRVLSDLKHDDDVVTTSEFLSLGIDRGFCMVSCWNLGTSRSIGMYRRVHIMVRTYGTDDFRGESCLVVSKQWMRVYKIHDSIRKLQFPFVADVISV